MLQFFIKQPYHSIFQAGYIPRLEYICNVGAEASIMPRKMHEHKNLIEILLVYSGVGVYIINAERYTAKKGDLILYNSNTVHDEFGGVGSNLGTYCIALSNFKLTHIKNPNTILPANYSPIVPTNEHFDDLLKMFQLIEREYFYPNSSEIVNYLSMAIATKACDLIKRHGIQKKSQQHTLSHHALKYIDLHYKDDIKLEDIAKAVNANIYYLSHVFKDEIGISPMKYVIFRRLGEAQNLLINTSMTVTQIAISVGYNNSNYFQNVFKAAMHMTPRQYRIKWTK